MRIWAFPLRDTPVFVKSPAWHVLAVKMSMDYKCQRQSQGSQLETIAVIKVIDNGGLDQRSCSVSGEKWSDCGYILKIIANKISCSNRGGDKKKRGLSNCKNGIAIFWGGERVHVWEVQSSMKVWDVYWTSKWRCQASSWIYASGVWGRNLGWRHPLPSSQHCLIFRSQNSEWDHPGSEQR